jgi:hypothetical protein
MAYGKIWTRLVKHGTYAGTNICRYKQLAFSYGDFHVQAVENHNFFSRHVVNISHLIHFVAKTNPVY